MGPSELKKGDEAVYWCDRLGRVFLIRAVTDTKRFIEWGPNNMEILFSVRLEELEYVGEFE